MTLEGRITIDLFPEQGAVKIASSRPLTITRQFTGHRPEDVVRTVSLLFATCRAAQTIASAEAFEDALGLETPESTKRVRALLVLAETTREHALRILMDWPLFLRAPEQSQDAALKSLMRIDRDLTRSLDGNGDASRLAGASKCLKDGAMAPIAELTALLEQAVLGEDLNSWGKRGSLSDLVEWAETRNTPAARLFCQLADDDLFGAGASGISSLPPLDGHAVAVRLFSEEADQFIAQPEWEGLPRETSPLTRSKDHPLVDCLKSEAGHGLGARLVACLVELARTPAQMVAILEALDDGAEWATRGEGAGVGQVEAARGRLVHAAALTGEKVRLYRILAPTEWNFHPKGGAACSLERIATTGGGGCAKLARLFVTAVDPCVGADVRVH